MNLSSRRFLIAPDGVLYRLADATFARMLRNPASHAFPALAGQRVRMASLIVELIGRAPVRVARGTFGSSSGPDNFAAMRLATDIGEHRPTARTSYGHWSGKSPRSSV